MIRAAVVALGLWGCGPMPQTPAEFRSAVRSGGFGVEVTSFDSARTVIEITEVFQARASACLQVQTTTTETGPQTAHRVDAVYTPKLEAVADHVQLTIQERFTSGVVSPRTEPPDGHYLIVADAIAKPKGGAHVDLYGATRGVGGRIRDAVRLWALGTGTECPDMRMQ